MVTFSYKSVVIVVVSFIAFAIVEGVDFSHYKKCPKRAGKFPIPGSFCTSFYVCENWKVLREEKCPQDQNFNPNKGWCDYEELYPCLEKPSRKECPRSNGHFLKNGTECEIYFDCCNGKPTEKKCPKGQLFDATSGKCDWEELVECDGSSKNKECPKPNGKFLKPGTKCRVYFECCKGKAKEKKCPKYHLFSTKTGKCEWKERVVCKEKENKNCPKPDGRFLKPGTDCKVYFDCRRGRETEKKCPKNQLFDYKEGKCDWEELVTCKEETSSESSSSESNESYEESTPRNKISSPPTFPDTVTEELISNSITTEEEQSPSPVTFTTSEKVESPLPTAEITNKEASYSTSGKNESDLTESTTLVSKFTSPEITNESSPQEENRSSEPTTKSIVDPITKETTFEDILSSSIFPTKDQKISTIEEISSSYQTEPTTKILEPITMETTAEDLLPSTHFSTDDPKVSTVEEISSSYQTEPTTKILEPITIETTEDIFPSTHLTTEDPEVSTVEEISSSYQTELTPKILEPSTMETTEDILPSTHFSTEDPKVSTIEDISSSYQTEQPSSYGSRGTILEEISTEPEQTPSSFKTTQFLSTGDVTSKIVDIISSDSTDESSSVGTKSEIFSTSAYRTTIDPALVGFVCPEESGYYPHPTNKHKFIGCVHNIAYIMDCPSNLVYNHKQRQCLYDN